MHRNSLLAPACDKAHLHHFFDCPLLLIECRCYLQNMYEVIKTIGGRRYRYLQRSYRENGRVRTQSQYLGPVDGEARPRKPRRIKAVLDALVGLARRGPGYESEAGIQRRMADESVARDRQTRINDLLTAPTIALSAIREIADAQADTAERAAESERNEGPSNGPSEGSEH